MPGELVLPKHHATGARQAAPGKPLLPKHKAVTGACNAVPSKRKPPRRRALLSGTAGKDDDVVKTPSPLSPYQRCVRVNHTYNGAGIVLGALFAIDYDDDYALAAQRQTSLGNMPLISFDLWDGRGCSRNTL
jgi:hypothetical protein